MNIVTGQNRTVLHSLEMDIRNVVTAYVLHFTNNGADPAIKHQLFQAVTEVSTVLKRIDEQKPIIV